MDQDTTTLPTNTSTVIRQVLFKVALAMLTLRASLIISQDNPGDLFNVIADTPASMRDANLLMKLRWVVDDDGWWWMMVMCVLVA